MEPSLDLVHDGDLLLVEGFTPFARIVKWWTRSKYSHAAMLLWITHGDGVVGLYVLEAVPVHGVRLVPIKLYIAQLASAGERAYWFRIKDPKIERSKVVGYGAKQLGKRYARPYQFLVSFGWLTRIIRALCGKPVEDLDDDRYFCSELCEGALEAGGANPINDPRELAMVISKVLEGDDYNGPASVEPGRLAQRGDVELVREITMADFENTKDEMSQP